MVRWNGVWQKWSRNLFPTPVGMLGSGVSLGATGHARDGVSGRYPSFIVREWFSEQLPCDKTWAYIMCMLGLGFWVEEIGVMGYVVGPKFKAQMDLGTLVPYISPPLIHGRLPGRIKESKRRLHMKRLTGGSLGGFRNPLMRSQKARYFESFGLAIIIT